MYCKLPYILYNARMARPKQKLKTVQVSMRMDKSIKDVADRVARIEHRNFSNLIEKLVLDHGKSLGIEPESQVSRSAKNEAEAN